MTYWKRAKSGGEDWLRNKLSTSDGEKAFIWGSVYLYSVALSQTCILTIQTLFRDLDIRAEFVIAMIIVASKLAFVRKDSSQKWSNCSGFLIWIQRSREAYCVHSVCVVVYMLLSLGGNRESMRLSPCESTTWKPINTKLLTFIVLDRKSLLPHMVSGGVYWLFK